MADQTKDVRKGEGETPEKRHGARRFLRFALILVVVLGIVLVAAYRDGTGFDALRRTLSYGSAETAAEQGGYDYDGSASNRFAVLGDRLVVLSDTKLRVLDGSGGEVWSTPVRMESPALVQGGGRAAAYDVGGRQLIVVDQSGELLRVDMEETERLIAANLNAKGMLAVTAEKKNYKGCVTVYDEHMEKAFDFNSSRRFVVDGYVTDDGAALAAVTLGQEDGAFVSNVVLYDLTQTEPKADYDVTDGLVLAIGQQGGKLITVADTNVTFAAPSGEVTASYRYGDEYLRDYTLEADGFTALLLNRYQSGSVGRLVTLAPDGTVLGELDVNEEVQSMSAAGKYLAVLYIDTLVIYNQDLQVYASLKGTDLAKETLVRPDGSALLLSAESAKLFLP